MEKVFSECAVCKDKNICGCFEAGGNRTFCHICGERLCRRNEKGDCVIEGKYIVCRNGPSEGQIVAVCYHVVHC